MTCYQFTPCLVRLGKSLGLIFMSTIHIAMTSMDDEEWEVDDSLLEVTEGIPPAVQISSSTPRNSNDKAKLPSSMRSVNEATIEYHFVDMTCLETHPSFSNSLPYFLIN